MKRTIGFTICAAVLAAMVAVWAAEESPSEFELQVGKAIYAVDLDKPFEIQESDGKKLRAVLRLATVSYSGHGLRFSHPGDMKVKALERTGRVMFQVNGGKGYFADLQLFLEEAGTPESALNITVRSVKSRIELAGAKFGPDSECRAAIAGKLRVGTRATTVGDKDQSCIDFYAVKLGGKVITIIFFYRDSNREPAMSAFRQIGKSLKLE